MTAYVKKIGGSVGVLIPKSLARDLGLVQGTVLEITAEHGSIRMQKARHRPRRPIAEIVAELKVSKRKRLSADHRALINDPPVGKEVW